MRIIVAFCLAALPLTAVAQTPVTEFPWNNPGTYEPYSSTARAITGSLTVMTQTDAFLEGSSGQIRFGSGKAVTMTSMAGAWREWSDIQSGKYETADVKNENNRNIYT